MDCTMQIFSPDHINIKAYITVAAISDRHLFWLQNQNNQTTITSLHQNQLKQIIYNVEPILQSFRLANTVRRYIICNNFPIFINFVLT